MVIAVGEGSKFEVGDYVVGSWGMFFASENISFD